MSAQQGEWAAYGAYMDELEKAINSLGKSTTEPVVEEIANEDTTI